MLTSKLAAVTLLTILVADNLFHTSLAQNDVCPQGCLCLPLTIRCISIRLKRIPTENIPTNTVVLDLRYNQIEEIKNADFHKFPNLERLFLGNNYIKKIEKYSFSILRKLKHLYLFTNRIEKLEENTFSGLRNLEQLYLQNNGISTISPKAFSDLVNLQRLYLHRNQLTHISKEMIAPMKSLRRMRLSSNRVPCTCEFLRFVKEVTLEGNIYMGATCIHNSQEQQANALKYSDLGCYKPKILSNIEPQVAVLGATIRLPCEADGFPVPTIYWLMDGNPIGKNIQHRIQKDGTLVLTKFAEESAGYYQCVVENVIGKNLVGATVGLVSDEVVPSFLEKPSDVDAIVNSIALLNCRATGYPRPDIIWVKNGQLIRSNGHFTVLTTGDLEIQSLEVSDSGYYTCRVENNVGSITHTAQLVVKAPPTFAQTPENQNILDGETAAFECKATGFPQPAIAWQKDGNRLPSDGRHVVLPSGTLRVLYARKENEGMYECQAINVIGVIAARANLTVRSRVKPLISVKPPDMTVQSGNTIAFRCVATGAPKPVISWIRNGVQVTTGNRFSVNANDGVIEIKDIGKVDAGRWECVARNNFGFSSEAFSLTVIGPKNGKYKGDKFVLESLEKAKNEVDRAIQLTKQKLNNFQPRSPADLLALFRFPSPDAIKIARSAEIFEIALELIQKSVDSGLLHQDMKQKYHFNGLVSPEHIRLLANLSGCTAHHRLVNCSDLCFHQKYRSFDGSCNNFNHAMWGASLTPFSRLLVPNYENGFNTPVGWNKSTDLPSARKVSLNLISSKKVTSDGEFTHMLMQWGQFLDHDMDFTVTSPSTTRFNDGTSCRESCENQQPCFPIKIPKDDPRIKRYKCMEFTRSSAVCGSGSTSVFFDSITPRQQINQITSFIDASNVYGSTDKDAHELRSFDDDKGLLKQGIHYKDGKFLLPFNQDTPIDCQVNKSESRIPCFLAGDHRANEQLGLLSMHTLWMRQHNRLVKQLHRLNPHWNGEKLYHEARKIVGAQMQHISFNEWLPKILGKTGIKKLGPHTGYNPNIDPTIFNSFATGAFRFGHTLIQPFLARLNEKFEEIPEGNLPLHKAFFSPFRLVEEGGIDPLLRGLFGIAAKDRSVTNQPFNSELTERLFEMAHTVALDLAALNVQRGRDHGLPTYNSWRQFCNMTAAENFEGFKNEIKDKKLREKMKEIYGKVENVDMFVAGILEDPLPGSKLGPLFMCLITLQFKRLRDGDRLWHENPGVFTPEQLVQIKQTTLGRVMCENSDNIRHVQRDVFTRVTRTADYIPCFQHSDLDLRFWKECCQSNRACSTFDNFRNRVTRVSRARRSLSHMFEPNDAFVANSTLNDHTKSASKSKNPPDEKKTTEQTQSHKKHKHKLRMRIKDVERKIEKYSDLLADLKEEVAELKRFAKIGSHKVRQTKHKQCIDQGLVRDHEQVWFSIANKKCSCLDSKITCS